MRSTISPTRNPRKRRRVKRVWKGFALSVPAAVAVFSFFWGAYALYVRLAWSSEQLPPHVGNRPAVRESVPPFSPTRPFSFAVVGDMRADETFDVLIRTLCRQKPAFIALIGDVARDATVADHRFLRAKMHRLWDISCPVFYLPGNHDVARESFPLSRFERIYGPTNFSLTRGPYRFVFLRLLPKYDNKDTLRFLEEELVRAEEKKERVLVFGHCSPHVSPFVTGRTFDREDELLRLLTSHRAVYYFGGDFHGYCRTTIGPTTFVCTGGGGARLARVGSFSFHHAMIVTISGEKISERLCVIPKAVRFPDRIAYLSFRGGWLAVAAPLAAGVLLTAVLFLLIRPRSGDP